MISIAPLNRARDIFLIIIVLMVLLLVACGEKHKQSEKAYTVGVVNFTSSLDPALEGFKVGMAALGYNEGKNIVYKIRILRKGTDAFSLPMWWRKTAGRNTSKMSARDSIRRVTDHPG